MTPPGVTPDEILQVLAVTDGLGIHRERVRIPLGKGAARVRRLASGDVEIVLDANEPLERQLIQLPERVRAALGG